jgi:hypothetical protein
MARVARLAWARNPLRGGPQLPALRRPSFLTELLFMLAV